MPNLPRNVIEIGEFPGMKSCGPLADAENPGLAQVQVNIACVRPGEIVVRGGIREVSFDTES